MASLLNIIDFNAGLEMISCMRTSPRLVALVIALVTTANAQVVAPASIAGKVYHETGGRASLRTLWNQSIYLRPDGTYHFIFYSTGSTFINAQQEERELQRPPNDGTYRYQRTGDTSAVLTLEDPTGSLPARASAPLSLVTLVLDFSAQGSIPASPHKGVVSDTSAAGSFFLSDWSPDPHAPLLNTSLRGYVAPGKPVIVGFVVPGSRSSDVLIRVVGPGLAPFGLTAIWADPVFSLRRAGSFFPTLGAYSPDWSTHAASTDGLRRVFDLVGAFTLPTGSKDGASVVRLAGGAYTILCSAEAGDVGGEVLVEVYVLP
jgi:hypothetical protein